MFTGMFTEHYKRIQSWHEKLVGNWTNEKQYKETAECKNLYDMILELHERINSLEEQNSTMIRLLGHLDSKLGNLSNED